MGLIERAGIGIFLKRNLNASSGQIDSFDTDFTAGDGSSSVFIRENLLRIRVVRVPFFLERTQNFGLFSGKFPPGEQKVPDSIQNTDQGATHEEYPPGQQIDDKVQHSNIEASDCYSSL